MSDGVDDRTRDTIEPIMRGDKRIKFIEYHPAKGGNIARNKGIMAATGEFVAFLTVLKMRSKI